MKTPNFINDKFVDEKGFLTESWGLVLSTLFSQLQQNFSAEGLITPNQTTTNINQLAVPEKNGAFFYDKDVHKTKIIENGVVKTVTTT